MARIGLNLPLQPWVRAWFPPTSPQGKRKAAAWLLLEKPRKPFVIMAPFVVSLCPPGRGQAQCGSMRGSGEVLDRVADLHTGPIKGPPQTQHSQQNDKCPGCIDASISLCMLPCPKLTKEKRRWGYCHLTIF